MERNRRGLMLATVPLYLGPLLAGLSGQGWSGVPVFIALMALWLIVVHPDQWPRQISLWTPSVRVAAAAQVAINAVIVVVLFGIGRGLGAIAGIGLPLSPLLPVGLSFLSIPLSRLVWDPVKAQRSDPMLDGAIDPSTALTLGTPALPGFVQDPMLLSLFALHEDADPVLTADAIAAAMQAPEAALRLSQLERDLCQGTAAHTGLREGLILWATDPARGVGAQVQGAMRAGFLVAGDDARLLELFVRRALPLLQAQPKLWSAFPDARTIRLVPGKRLPEAVQDAFGALAAAVEAATPREPRPH